MSKQHFLYLIILFFLSCTKEEDPLPQDCAGIAGGNSICGCMDSTAFNYNSEATHDDGSCQFHDDNDYFYLSFNVSNYNVDLRHIIYDKNKNKLGIYFVGQRSLFEEYFNRRK